MANLKTLKTVGVAEFAERKSRFIGCAKMVETEADAIAFLAEIRGKHREATHHVYAYQVGLRDEIQRSSDDGEPSGTGGRPILEVIKNQQLQNTMVVVTRYFGGILLGAGGLVRAYSKAAALALTSAGIVFRIPAQTYSLAFPYPNLGRVENFLATAGYQLDQTVYQDRVTMRVTVALSRVPAFLKELQELSADTLQAVPLGDFVWLEEPAT